MIKKHSKVIVYISALLLILNSGLLSAVYSLNNSALAYNDNSHNNAEKILLCTSQGFKWVTISDLTLESNSTSLYDSSSLTSSQHCPFCHISAHLIDSWIVNTNLSISLNPSFKQSHRVDLIDSLLYQHDRLINLPSRAPPQFS